MARRLVLAAIALAILPACKLQELRDFFRVEAIEPTTELAIETLPKLGVVEGAVEIDGIKVTDKTPFVAKGLAPGSHQVRVSAKGYVGQEMEVETKQGATTPLSLALQALPAVKVAPPSVHAGGARKSAKDTAEAEPAPSAEFSPHVAIVTATPPTSVTVDGTTVGVSTGLHMRLDQASGEIVLGGVLSLSYFNRGNHVSVRPNVDSKSTLAIDGEVAASGKGKWLELDQRPRRIEITDISGARRVVLLKLAE